ncbi:MAG: response regulator [Gammaproteobacteria bacterium]|nr:response regulator [Gammaproteobacteria bacterium]
MNKKNMSFPSALLSLLVIAVIGFAALISSIIWSQQTDSQLREGSLIVSSKIADTTRTLNETLLNASQCGTTQECRDAVSQYLNGDFASSIDDIRVTSLSYNLPSYPQTQTLVDELKTTVNNISVSNSPSLWPQLTNRLSAIDRHFQAISLETTVSNKESLTTNGFFALGLGIAVLVLGVFNYLAIGRWHKSKVEDSESRWAEISTVNEVLDAHKTMTAFQVPDDWDEASKKVVNKLRNYEKDIAATHRSLELFQNLNKALNYEFRTLTNTVGGGLKLISGKVEGRYLVLANEMIQSTRVLEELANNFYGIFSDSSKEQSCSVATTFDRLTALIAAKSERNHQLLECYIASSVPKELSVAEVKLIWSVYLEVNRAIDLYRNKSVLMCVSSPRRTEKKVQLSIDFYFLSDLESSISNVQNRDWGVETEVSYRYSDLIFDDNVGSDLTYAYDSTGDVRYRLSLELKPVNTADSQPALLNTSVAVAGRANLTRDVISQNLLLAGADVSEYTESFDALSADLDAIVVVDPPEGTLITPYLNSVKAALPTGSKTKVLLSTPTSKLDVADTLIIDHVSQRPTSPHMFIDELKNTLLKVDHSTARENSRVVCIDDDPTHGFLLTTLLEEMGWNAKHFESAVEAIDYIVEEHIDLVFMDCVMPEVDGFEATRRLRAYQRSTANKHKLTIIGATGLTSVSEMNECIAAGMDFVINKPYAESDINRVLNTYTTNHKIQSGSTSTV